MARLYNLWMASDPEWMVGYVYRLGGVSRGHQARRQRLALSRRVRQPGLLGRHYLILTHACLPNSW